MKLYILEKKDGVAVMVAKNATQALTLLLEKEEGDPYLSYGANPVDDLREVDLRTATPRVVTYFAN